MDETHVAICCWALLDKGVLTQAEFAAEKYQVPHDQVVFLPNRVRLGNQEIPFADLVKQAQMLSGLMSAAKSKSTNGRRDR